MHLPTFEAASDYLKGSSSGGYFQGRKVPDTFRDNDTYNSYGYNQWHGLQRAQKVVEALRKLSNTGPITLGAISKLYVSVWDQVRVKECAQMDALIKEGKSNEALAMYKYHSVRSDADCVGVTGAMDLDPQQKAGAQMFARGLANRHFEMQTPGNDVPSAATPKPSTPASTPITSPAPPRDNKSSQQESLAPETKQLMGPGLRRMFGGKEPEGK
jgi:hypothetical protein